MPERKTLNEDLFYRGSSANLPRLHTCKNKVPFWDFSQFAVTTLTLCPINSGVLTSLLLPHLSSSLWLPAFLESLMPLKNWCSIHARCSKSSLKQNFIAYRSSKLSNCIFEIHQLWQSGFSRVYSNSCCSCSFEPEIIKIGQSSHKMYSNNILNFQESTTILNACTKKKKVWKLIECTTYKFNNQST